MSITFATDNRVQEVDDYWSAAQGHQLLRGEVTKLIDPCMSIPLQYLHWITFNPDRDTEHCQRRRNDSGECGVTMLPKRSNRIITWICRVSLQNQILQWQASGRPYRDADWHWRVLSCNESSSLVLAGRTNLFSLADHCVFLTASDTHIRESIDGRFAAPWSGRE